MIVGAKRPRTFSTESFVVPYASQSPMAFIATGGGGGGGWMRGGGRGFVKRGWKGNGGGKAKTKSRGWGSQLATKADIYRAIRANTELEDHYLGNSFNTLSNPANPADRFTDLPMGTAPGSREGDEIKVERICVNYFAQLPQGTNSDVRVRVLMWVAHNPDINSAGKLLQVGVGNNVLANLGRAARGQYTIIYDELLAISATAPEGTNAVNARAHSIVRRINQKVSIPVRFNGDELAQNQIYFQAFSDVNNGAHFEYNADIFYTDA